MSLSAITSRLERTSELAVSELGSQLYVSVAGEVVADFATGVDGRSESLSPASLLAQYCTLKPIVATGVLGVMDDGDLDDAVGDWLSGLPSELAAVPLRSLMSHAVNLRRPTGLEYRITPHHGRLDLIAAQAPYLDREPGYSEAAAWHILGLILEVHVQQKLAYHLTTDHLFADIPEWSLCGSHGITAERVSVGAAFGSHGWMPLLAEATNDVVHEWNPGYGGYASARSIGRMYERLLTNENAAICSRLAGPERVGVYDSILGRVCDFGLGAMINLETHSFGNSLSPSAFGHSGYSGQSFAFADPANELVVSVATIGSSDPTHAVQIRRPQLIQAITTAVSLS